MKLSTINWWLSWTGFVLVVGVDTSDGPDREPTTLRLVWVGWPTEQGWARHCERSRKAVKP